jgi:GWxTD domain-containing protein
MMNRRRLMTLMASGLAVWTAAFVACAVRQPIQLDPFFQSFLEKTRYLMTDEEIEFFVHLPDAASKELFIEDFWKLRDPNPATPENENKLEFERRIQFANEWFGVLNQTRRTPAPPKFHLNRGWRTDRGLAYLVLGPPDLVSMPDSFQTREPVNPDDGYRLGKAFVWYYLRFRAPLYFGGPLSMELSASSLTESELAQPLSASRGITLSPDDLERAKEEWISRDQPGGLGEPLRFTARYRRKALELEIPIKSVRFKEREDRSLFAAFEFLFPEKEAENLRQLEIRIPYEPAEKGSYFFEVIVQSDDPSILSRRRQTVWARL